MTGRHRDSQYMYTGCFFEEKEWRRCLEKLPGQRLEKTVEQPHVTFRFPAGQVDESLLGEPVRVKVTGYGCDGQNEGLRVEAAADREELKELIRQIPVPHITVSLAEGASAKRTNHLSFEGIPPYEIKGIYGACRHNGEIVLQRGTEEREEAPASSCIRAVRCRYIVPFIWDGQAGSGYSEYLERLRADERWETRQDSAEIEAFDYIQDSLREDADRSNIGCSWHLKNTENGSALLTLGFHSKTGREYPVCIRDAGLYLFRTGVGLFWYEADAGRIKDIYEWMRFQKVFKELSYPIAPQKKKLNKSCLMESAPARWGTAAAEEGAPKKESRAGSLEGQAIRALGEWVNAVLKPLFPDLRYFAERRTKKNAEIERKTVADKALLFQYAVIDPEAGKNPEEELLRWAFCLTSGEDEDTRTAHLESIRQKVYYPYNKRLFYASRGGCGHYVLYDESAGDFCTRPDGLRKRWITNYFPLYIILLYQSYSLLYFTHRMEKALSADMEPYRENDPETLNMLDEFRLQINTFLVKGVYASVAHMENINEFYYYVQRRLHVEEDIRGLEIGLEALAKLVHLMKEDADREKEKEQEKMERGMQNWLVFLSILTISSAAQDLSTVMDRINKTGENTPITWPYRIMMGGFAVVMGISLFLFFKPGIYRLFRRIREKLKGKK